MCTRAKYSTTQQIDELLNFIQTLPHNVDSNQPSADNKNVPRSQQIQAPSNQIIHSSQRSEYKSAWQDFRAYKSQSVYGRSYSPYVQKFVIPKKDFTDINISNFILFYVSKHGRDNVNKLNQLAHYLVHCFIHHRYGHKLSVALESFPKANRTLTTIHQNPGKKIRIFNVLSNESDLKRFPSQRLSHNCLIPVCYEVVEWSGSTLNVSPGLFTNKQIRNYEILLKLDQFATSKRLSKECSEIRNFLMNQGITSDYFSNHSRREFVELLKNNCSAKVSLGMKLWNHFIK